MLRRVLHRAGVLAIALSCLLLAQSADRDQSFRDDLAYLARELPARHANVFHQTTRVQFDAAVDALHRDIPQLGDTEIMVRLARIVASVGDSHTSLPLPQGRAPFRRFPLTFFGFEDGWRIDAASPELVRLLGCRIVQIGDTPVDEVYARVASVISHENEAWLKRQFPSYARWADVLKTVGVIDSLDSARWTVETLAGERFSLDIPSVPQPVSISGIGLPDNQGFTPLYRRNTAQYYWYTYLESSRTLYFGYNSCTDSAERPFTGFTQELFRTFDTQPVDRLIIDLRNNPGGNSSVINPFLSGLQARQARFADGTKKFVIIGRSTASSAMLNAISLQQQPYTVLIGEPTGGRPNSYGELQRLTLPYSGATVGFSSRFIVALGSAESVLPDWNVPLYSRDYFARHDPFLAAALGEAPPPTAPPDAAPLVNSASFRPGPVAPDSLASLFVTLPGVSTAVASAPLPDKLEGVEVRFDGQAARLLAVTPGQVNLLVPADLPPGTVKLQAFRDGVEVLSGAARIASSSPGLFLADLARGDQPGAVLNQDSSLNSSERRARRGEVIQIFASGVGANPRVFIAGEPAPVTYSGLSSQFPGLWQINVRLPDAAPVSGQVPVFVIGDTGGPLSVKPGDTLSVSPVSNGVTLWVEE